MKRLLDMFVSFFGLLFASPVLLPVLFLIWWQDRHSPFYIAPRIGRGGKTFKMVKVRSMVIHADKSGVASTSANDNRITPVGHFVRRFKIDELTQLWNVLIGDMSLVGPRPNVQKDVDLYTPTERHLLDVQPGITDFSSIVFSDEGDILKGSNDPDLRYNQVIRPWKSRLGLFYIEHKSVVLDITLVILTVVAIVSKQNALDGIVKLLTSMKADPKLIDICRRQGELLPYPPPGTSEVAASR